MQRNDIEISAEARIKTEGARQALLALRKTFQHWVMIGDAIGALRARAEELGGRKTFHRLLEQQGLGTLVKAKAITSRLEKIMARLPEVEAWHRSLTEKQQIEWSSPGSIINHCPIFAKKESRAQGKTKPTPSTVTTLTKEVDRLQAAYDEVKEENASLREQLKSARGVKPQRAKIPDQTLGELKPQIAAALSKMTHSKRHTALSDLATYLMKEFPDMDIQVYGNIGTIKIGGHLATKSPTKAKTKKAKTDGLVIKKKGHGG